jgi:hypothetical protein
MDLLVGMLQQIRNVMEPTDIFVPIGRARKGSPSSTRLPGGKRRPAPEDKTRFGSGVSGPVERESYLVSHLETLDARVSAGRGQGIGRYALGLEVAHGQAGALQPKGAC